MTKRDAIFANVLVEERWAHVHARRGVRLHRMSALSAEPVANGGLGRLVHPPVLRQRAAAYDQERRRRLEAARQSEHERRVDAAATTLARADMRVAAAARNGHSFIAAYDAYGRVEAAVERRLAERVPLTRWMRDSDEIDVALALLEAMTHLPSDDRPHLVRSLELEAPLTSFVRRLQP